MDGEAGSFAFSSSEADDEAGTLGMRARLTPDKRPFGVELDGDLKIVDFKPVYQGKFTLTENKPAEAQPVSDQSGALRVTGGFELTNERIRVPEYRLEIGPKDDPYLVTGEATLDTGKEQEFLLLADGQQIDVSRIGNTGEAGKTGRDPAVSVRQRLAAMMAIAADIPIPQVPGRASLKLPAIVIGDTTVRDVRLDLRPDGAGWMVDNAVAQLPGRTQFEAKGRLQLSGQRAFRGDMLVASNQPSGLAAWVAGSVDPAIRKLKTAGFSATVNLTDTLQQFERLEVAAGPAVLRGRIERQALDGVPPNLSLQLKGNRIDLEALQALAGLVAGDASNETVLSHTIAADLSAEHFSAFDEDASDVQLVATLKNGQLQAERVSIGNLAGTQLALSGRMSGDLSRTGGFGQDEACFGGSDTFSEDDRASCRRPSGAGAAGEKRPLLLGRGTRRDRDLRRPGRQGAGDLRHHRHRERHEDRRQLSGAERRAGAYRAGHPAWRRRWRIPRRRCCSVRSASIRCRSTPMPMRFSRSSCRAPTARRPTAR